MKTGSFLNSNYNNCTSIEHLKSIMMPFQLNKESKNYIFISIWYLITRKQSTQHFVKKDKDLLNEKIF